MNENVIQISKRIRELREILGLDSEQLAESVGISHEEYISYENAEKDIPIGVLYGIAAKMNIDPTELLTGEAPRMSDYSIVRGGNGVSIERFAGYQYSALAYNYIGRDMEPMIVTLSSDPGHAGESALVTHAGHEFNYVLSGEIKLIYGNHTFHLKEGDSIYFNPKLPHAQKAVTQIAKFLTVINEK